MSRHVHPSASAVPESEFMAPDASGISEPPDPVQLSGRLRGQAPPTVRVISASEGVQRKAEANPAVASPDERRRAAERFEKARADHAASRERLVAAARFEADAQLKADAALAAYEDARVEARRATVLLRQRQREATVTKVAVRRALEWVARLETLDDYDGTNGHGSPDLRASVSRVDQSDSPPAAGPAPASAADRPLATPARSRSQDLPLHPVAPNWASTPTETTARYIRAEFERLSKHMSAPDR